MNISNKEKNRITIKMNVYEFAILTDQVNEVRKKYASFKQAINEHIEKYVNAEYEIDKTLGLISSNYIDNLMSLFRKMQKIAKAFAWESYMNSNYKKTNDKVKEMYKDIVFELSNGNYANLPKIEIEN